MKITNKTSNLDTNDQVGAPPDHQENNSQTVQSQVLCINIYLIRLSY